MLLLLNSERFWRRLENNDGIYTTNLLWTFRPAEIHSDDKGDANDNDRVFIA